MIDKIKKIVLIILVLLGISNISLGFVLDKKQLKKKKRKLDTLKKKEKSRYLNIEQQLKKEINHEFLRKNIADVNKYRTILFRLKLVRNILIKKDIKQIRLHLQKPNLTDKEVKKRLIEVNILIPRIKKALKQEELQLLVLIQAYSNKYKKLAQTLIHQYISFKESDTRLSYLYLKYARISIYYARHYEKEYNKLQKKLALQIEKEIKKQIIIKETKQRNKEKLNIKKFILKIKQTIQKGYKKITLRIKNGLGPYKEKIKQNEFKYQIIKFILKQRIRKIIKDIRKLLGIDKKLKPIFF